MKNHLATHYAEALTALAEECGELTAMVAPANVPHLLQQLRDDPQTRFTQLSSICGVDYQGHPTAHPARFCLVYQLLSHPYNARLRVKAYLAEGEAAPSVTHVYPSANWYEREAHEMFGIPFTGHPDLRRLLTDDELEGYPLRKDFPLTGATEAYYDAEAHKVARKPVDLPQETRVFDQTSPWRGATGNASLAEEGTSFTTPQNPNVTRLP